MTFRPTLLPLLALAACAPDLRDDHPFDGQVNSGPLVNVTVDPDGTRHASVDATSKGSQVYMDLDEGKEMKAEEAFSTNGWDLAFKRFEVSMNGGASNPTGTVKALVVKGQTFAGLTQAPAGDYQQDGAKLYFEDAEGGWYTYDLSVHKVLPQKDLLWVVKTSSGAYFKIQMLAYYDASGTPAFITFDYAPVPAP